MSSYILMHSGEIRYNGKRKRDLNNINNNNYKSNKELLNILIHSGISNIKKKTFTETSSIGLTGETKTIYYFNKDGLYHYIDDGKMFDARNEKDIERQIKEKFRKGLWGNNNTFYRLNINDSLYHHGVLKQKWGVKNGPPYPLDRKARVGEKIKRLDNGEIKVVKKKKLLGKELKSKGILPISATYQNLDEWGKNGKTNVLYISGTSGSGKSTIASKIADKNTEVIHLDSYFDNINGPKNKDFNDFLDNKKSDYKKIQLPKDQININEWGKVVGKFEEDIEKYGYDAFKRNKKVIMEGVQLLDDTVRPDKSYFKDKPFIMLNTNILTSVIRANNRDQKHFEFNDIMNRLEWNKNIKNVKKTNKLKHSEV